MTTKISDIDIPSGWEVFVDEVSMGVYKVEASDLAGRNVNRTGIDLEEIVRSVVSEVNQIQYELEDT